MYFARLYWTFLVVWLSSNKYSKTFVYQEVKTNTYTFASWQKMTDKYAPIRIYIEGDGYAFNWEGYPTMDPTPKSVFLRNIAFNDPNPNVVYLARPCQYIQNERCSVQDWTTGRFSGDIVLASTQAVEQIAQNRPIILIGYSGGALLSGLVIEQGKNLSVQKWMTIAGVLNHTRWTAELNIPPLKDSQDLTRLPQVDQMHFIGDNDTVVPWQLTQSIVPKNSLVIVPNATHDSGYEQVLDKIY